MKSSCSRENIDLPSTLASCKGQLDSFRGQGQAPESRVAPSDSLCVLLAGEQSLTRRKWLPVHVLHSQ